MAISGPNIPSQVISTLEKAVKVLHFKDPQQTVEDLTSYGPGDKELVTPEEETRANGEAGLYVTKLRMETIFKTPGMDPELKKIVGEILAILKVISARFDPGTAFMKEILNPRSRLCVLLERIQGGGFVGVPEDVDRAGGDLREVLDYLKQL